MAYFSLSLSEYFSAILESLFTSISPVNEIITEFDLLFDEEGNFRPPQNDNQLENNEELD